MAGEKDEAEFDVSLVDLSAVTDAHAVIAAQQTTEGDADNSSSAPLGQKTQRDTSSTLETATEHGAMFTPRDSSIRPCKPRPMRILPMRRTARATDMMSPWPEIRVSGHRGQH